MRKLTLKAVALFAAVAMLSCGAEPQTKAYNEGINILPVPASLTQSEGEFLLKRNTAFFADSAEAETIGQFFIEKINLATGYKTRVVEAADDAAITLAIDPKLDSKAEGYKLSVRPDGVSVVGRDAAGLFYGMQTIMQLLPAEITSPTKVSGVKWAMPAVEIADAPRFEYRGIMLDVCRHFVPVDYLKKQIDVLSMFKINRLHWHLTEDQAWRIEIKKYPKLTEIGSRRIEGEGGVHEGFYTQEEIKELVAYAAERQITIIPEFELPGHELAAIAAYPELSCKGEEITPRIIWGVEDIVMCPAKPFTFQFIEDVIEEMVALFPSEYFHIGGDECPKHSWEECPRCQALIKAEGLEAKDGHSAEERLQSYVIRRVEDMLTARNRKLIGWDEILEGGLSPNASVMSWRGESGGIAAAQAGHNVVMTPNSAGYYLDHYQGDECIEPVAIGGYAPLSKTYSYDPIPEVLAKEGKGNLIMGVQGNLWSEYLYDTDDAEYRLYPRALAVAEVGWSKMDRKDYEDFARRVNNAYVRLDSYDVNYHIPQPEQTYESTNNEVFVEDIALEFSNTRGLKMVYTTDGSEPTASSAEYTGEPLTFSETTTLKIATLLPSGKMSPARTINVEKQSLKAAATPAKVVQGLKMTSVAGDFLTRDEALTALNKQIEEQSVETNVSYIDRPNDLVLRENFRASMRNYKQAANIAEGYLNIEEDGVYFFRTNSELWIDGKSIVNNDGEVKRFSRNIGSIALSKGLHPVKIMWIGNIIGGWPSNWDDGGVTIRKSTSDKARPLTAKDFYRE